MAAGALAALAGITGCGTAGPDAAGTSATPGLNGPYGAGGPFATITKAGPAATAATAAATAATAASTAADATATDATATATAAAATARATAAATAAPDGIGTDSGGTDSTGTDSTGMTGPVRVDGSTALNGSRSVSWLSALGYGVNVTAPQDVQQSTASPGDAEAGFYDAYYDRRPATACGYVVPAQRAQCPASLRRSLTTAGSLRNAAVGFVVVKADEAIVTLTGLVCGSGAAPGDCLGQHDPAWVFAGADTFDALWARIAAEGGNPLTATPLRRVAGHWYVDLILPSSAG